jgi:hypothetical protein
MSRFYINRKGDGQRETVDEFECRSEANAMLPEYYASDSNGADYWVSTRPCANWR